MNDPLTNFTNNFKPLGIHLDKYTKFNLFLYMQLSKSLTAGNLSKYVTRNTHPAPFFSAKSKFNFFKIKLCSLKD